MILSSTDGINGKREGHLSQRHDVISAGCNSKSTLRAAADELTERPESV
jgi:hypothetical protein